jgi:multidrug efflux pump subunit AcrA (membrane-fusion protein)
MTLGKHTAAGLTLAVLFLAASAALSDPAPAAKMKTDHAAATVKVEKGPLHATLSLKGIFAAAEMTEIILRPEVWASGLGGFSVLSAVEPGTAVKKGDVLVTLQTDKIDRAIREAEAEQRAAEVSLRLAEEELPALERSTPLELAEAQRSKQHADEDLKKWVDVDRPLAVESAERMVKNARHYLEYAQEELKQLQKMYRSKDLTEETEEIILKRQRHQVEMAEFMVRSMLVHRDQQLKVDLPRRDQSIRDNVAKLAIALGKAQASLPLALVHKRLALEKLRYEYDKSAKHLRDLKKDRELMPVRAPADGVVYHGKCTKGQWNSAQVTPKLQRGGSLQAEDVFMTVVSARPLVVNATVEEKELHWLKVGARGKAVPVGYPDLRLPVELTSLSAVPESAGTWAAVFKVEADNAAIVPGMNCTVKVVAYRNEAALTLPSSAVFSDDDEEHYVYRPGSTKKVLVRVGKTAGDRTEILEGLREGDTVLASKP